MPLARTVHMQPFNALSYSFIVGLRDEKHSEKLTHKSYYKLKQGVSIYRQQERAFSAGDRVQLTSPSSDRERLSKALDAASRT